MEDLVIIDESEVKRVEDKLFELRKSQRGRQASEEKNFIHDNTVIAKLSPQVTLRCPDCDKEITSLSYYPITEVFLLKCPQCGFEYPHPKSTPGMYWNFVWLWESKQNKHAVWANHNR
jgi:predicted RNA-binding Zn-ribbon protein involved in translation (DUF1610 family)